MQKILSVDDDHAILHVIQRVLANAGYNVCVADSPDLALQMIRDDAGISLVLLDIQMPKKTGFQVYKELLEIRKLPVLFVTAYPTQFNAQRDDIVEMWRNNFADGTTDIVYKPFDIPSLCEKVEGLIGPASEEG